MIRGGVSGLGRAIAKGGGGAAKKAKGVASICRSSWSTAVGMWSESSGWSVLRL